MPAIVVVGANWGDEGKGKVIDFLAEDVDMVVRYCGGHNAGHTVKNPLGDFAMHLIPCGAFNPRAINIIGNGVVVSPEAFTKELRMVQDAGIDMTGRLFVSDRAHLIMPYHKMLDGLDEKRWGENAIGTTGQGIGPTYADKAARLGIRVGDLMDGEAFRERLRFVLAQKNRVLTQVYELEAIAFDDLYEQLMVARDDLMPYIAETGSMVRKALGEGKRVLLEGAQGTLLDIDHGTYPYVTSSATSASGAALGSGIPPTQITKALGVFKAYTTRVGGGPMPTELFDGDGQQMRDRGQEYGTTTGRARRCGWFDAVAGKFGVEVNGFTGGALVRLDVLDIFPTVKICTAYRLDGKITDTFPSHVADLDRCEPVYEELPGWLAPTENARTFADLPANAQAYIRRLEEVLGCPFDVIGVGATREQTIHVRPVL